jgi:hypothetical protein
MIRIVVRLVNIYLENLGNEVEARLRMRQMSLRFAAEVWNGNERHVYSKNVHQKLCPDDSDDEKNVLTILSGNYYIAVSSAVSCDLSENPTLTN